MSAKTAVTEKSGLIEKYPCNDKMELLRRERYWVEHYKQKDIAVNVVNPTRIHGEWYRDNKEAVAAQHKEYYEANREVVRVG